MMFSKTTNSVIASCVWGCFLSALLNSSAVAQGVAVVEGSAHAKGVVLLRAKIPSVPCPRYTTLRVGDDRGQPEEELSTVTIGGAYIQSAIMESGACSLLVPAFAGPTEYHEIGFAFSHPGGYQVRWQFGSTGVSPVDFSIDQSVRIEPPRAPDLRFLQRVGDPVFLRGLFGGDFFERQGETMREELLSPAGADARALMVIARLLEATRAKEPGDVIGQQHRGDIEPALRWANSLWALTTELPDSSYAPYAAFYSGMCYWGPAFAEAGEAVRGMRVPDQRKDCDGEFLKRAELMRKDQHLKDGAMALEFAVEHGDDYLKPIALYHLACLRSLVADVEKGQELFDEVIQIAGEKGTIGELVRKIRPELEEMKRAVGRREPTEIQNGNP